eukprot:14046509-Alexandrium_andersonii.AAC.1
MSPRTLLDLEGRGSQVAECAVKYKTVHGLRSEYKDIASIVRRTRAQAENVAWPSAAKQNTRLRSRITCAQAENMAWRNIAKQNTRFRSLRPQITKPLK